MPTKTVQLRDTDLNHSEYLKIYSAKNMERYINELPSSKIVKQQIQILKEKIKTYSVSGESEIVTKLTYNLEQLQNVSKKLKDITKKKTNEEIQDTQEKIKNSVEIKEIRAKQKEISDKLKTMRPGAIANTVKKLRNAVSVLDSIKEYDDEAPENFDDIDLDIESDDDLKSANDKLTECYELIADILDISVREASRIPTGSIAHYIKKAYSQEQLDEISALEKELKEQKVKANAEMKRLKGYRDISDVMFSVFGGYEEMTEEEEADAKNMIASSQIPYIQAIAYNMCSKINKLKYLDDVVSVGLLRFSMKLNEWFEMQKNVGGAIDITDFVSADIIGDMKKHIFELSNGGTISGTNAATEDHFYRQTRKDVITELQKIGLPLNDKLIETLVSDKIYGSAKRTITSESDYKSAVGGDDAAKVDAWSLIGSGDGSGQDRDSMAENTLVYESLVSAIKSLVNLFVTDEKTNKKKKVFDAIDYQLFLMRYGLKTKPNGEMYIQSEMGDVIAKMGKLNSSGMKISQSAISSRLKMMDEKLNLALLQNPQIKKALGAIYVSVQQNPNAMRLLSNSRDENNLSYEVEQFNNEIEESEAQKRYSQKIKEYDDIDLSGFNTI